MNKFTFLIFFIGMGFNILAQSITIETTSNRHNDDSETSMGIQEFKLENGLTVFLNPDPNMVDVLGSIVVRGGANLDPENGEGTAHYFEHIMFKGTQKIGTIDYEQERPYLDSIQMSYDLLAFSKGDEKFRNGILKRIDRLSQEASKYAIPNEFNKVLSGIGGSQINAYTTYENIVYHNHFPAESMDRWIALQVDRMANPVFRLFQSELETVYEEKNMSMDNTFRQVYEELYKGFYPNSVYGKQTVLGSVESLKTPSISKMRTYHKENYVANNMALILVGNFDAGQVRSNLEATFGSWRFNEGVKIPEVKENAFNGRVVVKKKLTPIPIGVLGFRSVKRGDDDEIVLKVIMQLLSNDEATGLLDQLANKNELMFVSAQSDRHYDIGAEFIVFAPKPIIQSVKSGEKKIMKQIERLKTGDFDEQLMQAIKIRMLKDFTMNYESADYRSELIIDAFMTNTNMGSIRGKMERINSVSKKRIQNVAKKYFGDDYFVLISKMGSPDHQKLDKPDITPINAVNAELSSTMGQKLVSNLEYSITPKYIDFKRDVLHSDVANYVHFYYVNNPMNDIYTLQIKYGVGTHLKKDLKLVADYLNKVGSQSKPFMKFRNNLQLSGTTIECNVDESYFYINMSGFENSLSSDIAALNDLLNATELNEDILKKLVKDYAMDYKFAKKDIGMQSKILHAFAVYGDQSPYLTRMGSKEMKKIKVEQILASLKEVFTYETEIHYVGKLGVSRINEEFANTTLFKHKMRMTVSPVFMPLPEVMVNQLYFMDNKKAVQSHIKLKIPSKAAEAEERIFQNPFNRYFGLGMSSLVFREIREYNSLAYSAYAYVEMPFNFFNPLSLNGAMTTQADKTIEAIDLFTGLIDDMPIQEKSIDVLRNSLLLSFNSQAPSFRYRSQLVSYWMRQGYVEDPRIQQYPFIEELNINDIKRFYGAFVANRKYKMSVVGDSKRIDMDKLKEEAQFKEIKFKDIYKK